jgi:hypothetical protein
VITRSFPRIGLPIAWIAVAAVGAGCAGGGGAVQAVVAPPGAAPQTPQIPEAPEVRSIPGDFDRFDPSGATFSVLSPTREAPGEVVVLDATRFTEVGRRAVRHGAVAWTYGGKVQVVEGGKAFERIDVDTGRSDPIDPALVAPDGDPGGGAISDDGKLFTYHDLAVIDLDARRVAFTFDPPCAGGPQPAVWVAPSGRFVVGSCRGTAWTSIAGAGPSHRAWQPIADSYCISADERVLLEGPYQPFARDWAPDFVVRSADTGKPRRTLPLALPDASRPYAMALSGDGELAAVLLGGAITLYGTRDGTKLGAWEGPANALGATLAFRPSTRDIYVSTRGALRVVRGR